MNKIIIANGYVIATADTPFGSAENADAVEQMLCHQPTAPDGFTYKLRADNLEWELVELMSIETEPDEPTIEDKAEAYDILMGVSE